MGDAINPYLEVIDGQQRLTTISLFLTAIYTRLKEYKDDLSEDDEDVIPSIKEVAEKQEFSERNEAGATGAEFQ